MKLRFKFLLLASFQFLPLLSPLRLAAAGLPKPDSSCDTQFGIDAASAIRAQSLLKVSGERAAEAARKQQAFLAGVKTRYDSMAQRFPSAYQQISQDIMSFTTHCKHWESFFPNLESATWQQFYKGIGLELQKIHLGIARAEIAINTSLSKSPGKYQDTIERRIKVGNNWLKFLKEYALQFTNLDTEIFKNLPEGKINFNDKFQKEKLIFYGKRVDSILGEMRLALVLSDVIGIGIPSSDFITQLNLKDLDKHYYSHEFDVIYIDRSDKRVIFADAKTYDRTLTGKDSNRKRKLIKQIMAQLTIVNAYKDMSAGVQFYFLGGIHHEVKREIEELARKYILALRPTNPETLTFEIFGEKI